MENWLSVPRCAREAAKHACGLGTLGGSRHTGAHAVKLDAAADAAVLDLAAAADSRLPLARHGDFVNVIYNGFVVTRWRLT